MAEKVIVEYNPGFLEGGALPDGAVETYVTSTIRKINETSGTYTWEVCQELVINTIRVAIARELLDHSIVEFHYNGNVMFSDKFGYLDWWCTGFCDYTDKLLEELLTGGINSLV